MKFFTQTNIKLVDVSVLLLRLVVGAVLFAAGAGKVFGWFGGFGPEVTLGYYANMGISVPLAYLSMYTEFIGGFLLIIGFLTRIVSFALAVNMLVAVILSIPLGFFLGAAFPLVILTCVIAILLSGPLRYSIDYLLWPWPQNVR